jgi:hypothetical protein
MDKKVENFTMFADGTDQMSLIDRITSGIFLVLLGGVFLLNTLGVIPWDSWLTFGLLMANFWPLLLVAAGVSVILGDSPVAKILSSIMWYGIFIAFFAAANLNVNNSDLKERLMHSEIGSKITEAFNKDK